VCIGFSSRKEDARPQGGNPFNPLLAEGTKGVAMWNRRKWYSLLLVGLVLLLISSVVACASPATTPATPATSSTVVPPPSAILWSEAINHIGERTTVYGPVIGATYASGSKGKPTFLNVGKNYPDPARFTVLIWGSDRSKFSPAPEIQYKGRTIYVYGLIELYKGSAEIIVTSPSQIQVQ